MINIIYVFVPRGGDDTVTVTYDCADEELYATRSKQQNELKLFR